MKKIGIITLNGNNNFGNKLQNYALKKVIEKLKFNVETLWFNDEYDAKKMLLKKILFYNKKYRREILFDKFTKKYLNRKIFLGKHDEDFKFIVGSDQVWNYKFSGVNRHFERYFLKFSPSKKNVSYAASISANDISTDYIDIFKDGINNFSFLSVREDLAQKILIEKITKKNVEIVLDPTKLLSKKECDYLIENKSKKISNNYILNYFLGEQSINQKNAIKSFAEKYNYKIIDLLDEKSEYYASDPTDFLYLIKNASLICTDSFHASVFSIIFDKPFVVFDREYKGSKIMGSRIDTLISKFQLENRKYNGKEISSENLQHDYLNAYKILEYEKNKSINFLKKALESEKK